MSMPSTTASCDARSLSASFRATSSAASSRSKRCSIAGSVAPSSPELWVKAKNPTEPSACRSRQEAGTLCTVASVKPCSVCDMSSLSSMSRMRPSLPRARFLARRAPRFWRLVPFSLNLARARTIASCWCANESFGSQSCGPRSLLNAPLLAPVLLAAEADPARGM